VLTKKLNFPYLFFARIGWLDFKETIHVRQKEIRKVCNSIEGKAFSLVLKSDIERVHKHCPSRLQPTSESISAIGRVDCFNIFHLVHFLNKKSQVSPPVEPEHDNSADGETWDDGLMIHGKQVQVLCGQNIW